MQKPGDSPNTATKEIGGEQKKKERALETNMGLDQCSHTVKKEFPSRQDTWL